MYSRIHFFSDSEAINFISQCSKFHTVIMLVILLKPLLK